MNMTTEGMRRIGATILRATCNECGHRRLCIECIDGNSQKVIAHNGKTLVTYDDICRCRECHNKINDIPHSGWAN